MTYRIREPLQISNEDGTDVFTISSEDIPDGYGLARVSGSIIGHQIVPSGGMTGQVLTKGSELTWTGPSMDMFPTAVTNLYVSVTGDDGYGDGSIGNPYRTPRRAVDSIPWAIGKGAIVEINVGPGTFEFPDFSRIPLGIYLRVFGDRSSPIIETAPGLPAGSAVAGKATQYNMVVGAYGEAITLGSHWVELDIGLSGYPPYGIPTLASTSPNLTCPVYFDLGSYALKVHPYVTEFTLTSKVIRGPSSSARDTQSSDTVIIYGVSMEFEDPVTSTDVSYYGCKMTWSGNNINAILDMHGGNFSSYAGTSCFIRLHNAQMFYAYLSTTTDLFSSSVVGCVFASTVNLYGENILSYLDLQGASARLVGFTGSTNLSEGVTTSGATAFLDTAVTSSHFVLYRINAIVTGSVSGVGVTLRNGAQAIGIKDACNGTLTSVGSNIVVGGNAGNTFASLPATDVGAASPQFCRAT